MAITMDEINRRSVSLTSPGAAPLVPTPAASKARKLRTKLISDRVVYEEEADAVTFGFPDVDCATMLTKSDASDKCSSKCKLNEYAAGLTQQELFDAQQSAATPPTSQRH